VSGPVPIVEPSAAALAAETGGAAGPAMRRPRPWEAERLYGILPILVVLAAWEAAVRMGMLNALFFPPPSLVFRTIVRLTASGELPGHVAISLQRAVLGFVLGAGPGVLLGLCMGWSRRVRAAMEPLVSATYPVPKVALLPIVMLIFGIGEASKIVIVAISAFFPAVINAMTGVIGINPVYFEVAVNCGARRWKTFTRVVIPGSLPLVFAGLRLSLGMALLLVVAAEFVAARTGVGAMIWLAWQTLRTENLYAGVVTWAVLGVVSTEAMRRLEGRVIRWRPRS
jgi:ABC-type nitrate/sulfonate/bicarbonate transport system permease component